MADVIVCPICNQPASSPAVEIDHQEVDYCPDGYDMVGGMLIPRSAERDTAYVAGRHRWRLVPCGHPIAGAERFPDGAWLVKAYKIKEGGVGLEPVELRGRFVEART